MILFNYQPLAKACQTFVAMLFIAFVFGCKQPAKTPASKKDTVVKVHNKPAPATSQAPADTAVTDDECPKGAAEPVLKKSVFPDARFVLQPDHRTGIETLTLKDGDKLTIKQSGCEYYILTFQFETSHFAADTTDITYWSEVTLSLMRNINKGLDTFLDTNEALNKLSARIEKAKANTADKLVLGDEIDFGGPDPRQYLIIERISQLADQRYILEVSLYYGPI
ncbi:hypothetical protein [Mucilaginibacter lacusdianchii]|uniref:hypothetical protein n=1 Tax=Mucilaginibacter lacusdianchii TaxID=2684211 RepID=UPI00131DE1A8|nr:hypothetical protein [Mucilaginibacter sp. JXJ CY 39]